MRSCLCILGMLMLATVAGCESREAMNINQNFGDAVRSNIAVQTMNPMATGQDLSASTSGLQAEQTVQRLLSRDNQAQSNTLLQDVGSTGN